MAKLTSLRSRRGALSAVLVTLSILAMDAYGVAAGPETPQTATHQVTGLFSPEREEDLRIVFEQLPEIKLVRSDFEKAEVALAYDPAKAFPGATPEQIIERLDGLVRQASRHTFGVKPLATAPQDRFTRVEIPVVGLDCKGCSLGAYEAIYRIDGVERATVSFKNGLIVAWIDSEKTDRAALEDALKKRNVQLKEP